MRNFTNNPETLSQLRRLSSFYFDLITKTLIRSSGLFILISGMIISFSIKCEAQMFVTSAAGVSGGNLWPFNAAAGSGSNKVEMTFAPGDFSASPTSGFITKVYFRFTSGNASTYTNFTVAMTQASSITGTGTYTTPITTVYGPATTNFSPSTGVWYGLNLTTPFAYDATKILIIMVEQSAMVGGNAIGTQNGSILPRYRIYGNYGATSGAFDSQKYDFGFDVAKNNYLNFSNGLESISLNNSLGNFGAGDFTIQMNVRFTSSASMYLLSKRSGCGGG